MRASQVACYRSRHILLVIQLCRDQGHGTGVPVVYGLDCEMCETAVDSRALVRVCVVDENGNDVLDVSSMHQHEVYIL